jgi:saccharopine dehydrogenase (NAD+, L-lysine-forming)
MKKIRFYIIGSGMQGSSAASILSRQDFVDKVVLGDINEDILLKVSSKIGSDKIVPIKIDASNIESLTSIGEDVDVILNFTNPRFNINIMKAALKLGAHYVDTASGPDLELHPIDYMVNNQFKLDGMFKDKGLKALISCGYTPGISNVLARYIVDRLEKVESIRFRAAYGPLDSRAPPILKPIEKYGEIIVPTWSPEVSFLYRATQPVTYEDGSYVRHEPFSSPEEYDFPEPLGRTLNVLVDHEETVTIPKFIEGVKYVDYKNSPDIIAYALIKMGFAENKPVRIKNIEVIPRDVLLKVLRPPVNHFLEETEERLMSEEYESYLEIVIVEVLGYDKDGRILYKGILENNIPPKSKEKRLEYFRKFGTTHFIVSLPAVTGAKLIVEGDGYDGVIAPEVLNPVKFLKTMEEIGYKPKITITATREI